MHRKPRCLSLEPGFQIISLQLEYHSVAESSPETLNACGELVRPDSISGDLAQLYEAGTRHRSDFRNDVQLWVSSRERL